MKSAVIPAFAAAPGLSATCQPGLRTVMRRELVRLPGPVSGNPPPGEASRWAVQQARADATG